MCTLALSHIHHSNLKFVMLTAIQPSKFDAFGCCAQMSTQDDVLVRTLVSVRCYTGAYDELYTE